MQNSLRTYARGTRQWGPVSGTAPSLPNFTARPVNGVAPNLNGLMDAASAIAANAINALGAAKETPDTVANMTAALVRGAVRFQKTSQTAVNGQLVRFGGTAGATATALVAQVAGDSQSDWKDGDSALLLQAVVNGAMRVARKQVVAIAYGAAAGFAGTYAATTEPALRNGGFDINQVAADILASFRTTRAVTARNEFDVNQAILAGLRAGLDETNWNDPVNGIAGIGGIRDFEIVNGQGDPLTDTVGL